MTKQDFWELISDIIDCDVCMFYDSCKIVKNHRITIDACVDELRRNYEELKEADSNDND